MLLDAYVTLDADIVVLHVTPLVTAVLHDFGVKRAKDNSHVW